MTDRSFARAVLAGGGLGGALDIAFALSFGALRGVSPVRVLQSVSSGLLGHEAFSGGVPAAALGLVLHFGLSLLWAALFVLAARRLGVLARRPVPAGIVFGVGVFLAMRLVVLPMSAFPFPVRFPPLATVLDLMSHMFLFGLPIALAARRAVAPPVAAR